LYISGPVHQQEKGVEPLGAGLGGGVGTIQIGLGDAAPMQLLDALRAFACRSLGSACGPSMG
jgi:hypothetical protein